MAKSCYIHVPFCAQICNYCDFYRILHNPDSEGQYVEAVAAEIGLRLTAEHSEQPQLETLYFGGGTPTVLAIDSWSRIFAALNRDFTFAPDIEVTAEANPESATLEKLTRLAELGVNRVSFGAQSFEPANLARLGRIHSSEQVGLAVENARKAGFAKISLDLIYGLPDETDQSLLSDLKHAVALAPQHLSFYALTLEGDVPMRSQVARGELAMPDDDILASRYLKGVEYLASEGYHHYEISNFARPGHECRHNLTYWMRQDYYAFGPAAVSTIGGVRIKNDPDLDGYIRNLARGKLPPRDEENITPPKQLLETIMLSLRLNSGLDVGQLRDVYGYDVTGARGKLLRDLQAQGDLVADGERICLTAQGMFRSDLIAACLCPDFV
jgi:oxygen-independent coproporphyrinogen-3 oxidase